MVLYEVVKRSYYKDRYMSVEKPRSTTSKRREHRRVSKAVSEKAFSIPTETFRVESLKNRFRGKTFSIPTEKQILEGFSVSEPYPPEFIVVYLISEKESGKTSRAMQDYFRELQDSGSVFLGTKRAKLRENLDKFRERVILDRATEVIGDRGEAMRWMGTPVRDLGYSTPVSLLHNKKGREDIFAVLTRLEHGVL